MMPIWHRSNAEDTPQPGHYMVNIDETIQQKLGSNFFDLYYNFA